MTILTTIPSPVDFADVRDTLNDTLVRVGGGSKATTTLSIVSDLTSIGWDTANFPIASPAIETLNGVNRCTNLDIEVLWKAIAGDPSGWPTYYVTTVGSDALSGANEAQAFATLEKAILTANAGGVPARVMVKTGYYPRAKNWPGSGGTTEPTVPLAMYAYSGRVVCSTADDTVTWAADGTYAWVYSCTRSNALRVLDLKARNARNHYPDLVKVADLVTCSRVPNSWALVGSTVYVHRADETAATITNTRVLMTIRNFSHSFKTMKSFYFGGVAEGDGFDFEGGLTSAIASGGAIGGCLSFTYNNVSQVPGSKVMIAAKGCTFRYSGGPSTDASKEVDVVQIQSLHGLAAFQNCDVSASSKDGFNVHNSYSDGYLGTIGAATALLTVNCSGYNNGMGTSVSNNCWTLHEAVKGLDICGDYAGARGSTMHIINTSRAVIVGSTSRESLGDIVNGGATEPCELRTENSAIMYARLTTARAPATSGNAARADDTSSILTRDSILRGTLRTYGTATIGTY